MEKYGKYGKVEITETAFVVCYKHWVENENFSYLYLDHSVCACAQGSDDKQPRL